MSIVLKNITKHFGPDLVLDEVSDEIPSGSMTALLGPSGSGKSTLLRIIAGLESLDHGTVELHGRDVTSVEARHRQIGFCFQDYAPFNQMTVFDNVAYGLKVRRIGTAQRKKEVDELLGLVRLSDFGDRYPRQLSGGQRQRMALARALAIKPEVLLLDEPFAALDAQVSGELRVWVRSLQRHLARRAHRTGRPSRPGVRQAVVGLRPRVPRSAHDVAGRCVSSPRPTTVRRRRGTEGARRGRDPPWFRSARRRRE